MLIKLRLNPLDVASELAHELHKFLSTFLFSLRLRSVPKLVQNTVHIFLSVKRVCCLNLGNQLSSEQLLPLLDTAITTFRPSEMHSLSQLLQFVLLHLLLSDQDHPHNILRDPRRGGIGFFDLF